MMRAIVEHARAEDFLPPCPELPVALDRLCAAQKDRAALLLYPDAVIEDFTGPLLGRLDRARRRYAEAVAAGRVPVEEQAELVVAETALLDFRERPQQTVEAVLEANRIFASRIDWEILGLRRRIEALGRSPCGVECQRSCPRRRPPP